MKINKNIEKYKNYVRVALKDAYGFNEEEIKDAMQNIELARIEALARGADENMTFAIIRKAVFSFVSSRNKERSELLNKGNVEAVEDVKQDSTVYDIVLNAFDNLNKKQKGSFFCGLLKSPTEKEAILEYADTVDKLAEKIAEKNPDLADSVYKELYDRVVITKTR